MSFENIHRNLELKYIDISIQIYDIDTTHLLRYQGHQ